MNAPTLEHVTDTVQDVAHKFADRAPDIASAVGRRAETVAETVSDAVVRLAQKTPFVEAPKLHRGRWMFRAAIVATIAGVAMWLVNRRRTSQPWYGADETPTARETSPTERRYATAGH